MSATAIADPDNEHEHEFISLCCHDEDAFFCSEPTCEYTLKKNDI